MDPALQELLLPELDPNEILEVLVRLRKPNVFPPKTTIVSQFGEIATCRIRRGDIVEVRAHESVRSIKAARVVGIRGIDEEEPEGLYETVDDFDETAARIDATGRGVVIGIMDWGCDFGHRDFIRSDGKSRFLSIWYQGSASNPKSPRPFQYGTEYSNAEINTALASAEPYKKLGYHPGLTGDPNGGAHGTHVAGIAAGGGAGHRGIAPEADLVFVHLSTDGDPSLNLGDTVRVLEALDYMRRIAGDRPLVVNMSLGAHGGSHDGQSLVELGMDHFLKSRSNTMICQSVGNYYSRKAHHASIVLPGKAVQFSFSVQAGDASDNELEVWYNGHDILIPVLVHEQTGLQVRCELDRSAEIKVRGQVVGRLYHRSKEPNNGKNHINLFLYTQAPSGKWNMRLEGRQVLDGRFDAWIERDNAGRQAIFDDAFVVRRTTNGTICNGLYPIAVGAVDRQNKLPDFSSSGPTLDGRRKPDIVAPGVDIKGAQSAPATAKKGNAQTMRASGTSMATPKVTGTVALILEKAQKPVDLFTLRTLLLASAHPLTGQTADDAERTGSGLLDPHAAVEAMKQYQRKLQTAPPAHESRALRQTSGNAMEQANGSASAGKIFLTPNDPGHNLPILAGADQSFASLDSALKAALQAGFGNSFIIRGRLFSGGVFELRKLELPLSPLTPLVVRLQASSPDICCLILDGSAPYFAADITKPGERWVQFPYSKEFYLQTDKTRLEQKKIWADAVVKNLSKISLPGAQLTEESARKLSAPELRLLLANFADFIFEVGRRNHVKTPKGEMHGGVMHGLTLPLLPVPFREPDCYIRVVAGSEGNMESINAWDGGAGISIGPVQFNVQKGDIFKFLWKVWQEDRELFDEAFSPLSWTMATNSNGEPLLNGITEQGKTFQLTGTAKDDEDSVKDFWRPSISYFHSGDPGNSVRDLDFRVRLTERFRKLIVWPHIQWLIFKISAAHVLPGVQLFERSGIKPLNTDHPDKDTFVLKAVVASAYVRFPGCARELIKQLGSYKGIVEKLEHLQEEVASLPKLGKTDCAAELKVRLRDQQAVAKDIYNKIQQTLQANSPTSPASETEAIEILTDDWQGDFDWLSGSVWADWSQKHSMSESQDCGCETGGEKWLVNDDSDVLLEEILSDNDSMESDINPESGIWANWYLN